MEQNCLFRYWPKFLSEKGNDLMLTRLRKYCRWHQKQVKNLDFLTGLRTQKKSDDNFVLFIKKIKQFTLMQNPRIVESDSAQKLN